MSGGGVDYTNLKGGYRVPYDPQPALERLKTDRDNAISELWENLYHQGDVDLASYAAVPALVDMGELSLVGAIEVARHSERNPDIPGNIQEEYEAALMRALTNTPSAEEQFQGYYIIHAAVNGQLNLATALHFLDVREILDTYATDT